MRQALECVRGRGGTVVIAGNARHGEQLAFSPEQLNMGKRLLGTWGGDNVPETDFPKYARLLGEGKIDLSPIMSAPYRLEQVNQALDDLEAGRVVRPTLDMLLA